MILSRRRRWLRRIKRASIAAAVCVAGAAITLAVAWRVSPFPVARLDRWPQSPRVVDRHGRVMMELVGADDQWRFPVKLEQMSPWLIAATVAVEDERFFDHLGVDPIAVGRAAAQNAWAGGVVSGASTLTMQVCRMMDDRPRTAWAKAVESLRALQLERLRSKDQIIELYLNVAPYGGNLRGVEAASQYFFGRGAGDLSLAEAAMLAGLPQSPTRLRPDRSLDAALARRTTVLRRMLETGAIDQRQHDEAAAQPVAIVARPTHRIEAPHASWAALSRVAADGVVRTTIDLAVQRNAERLVDEHLVALPPGTDASVVVIDIDTGDVVALVGSADADSDRAGQVNGATAWRSPGSALKPFVYAAAFEAGRLNAQSTVYDVPIVRGGWKPTNFDDTYHGELPAGEALRRSLNVPALLVAEGIGLPRCTGLMEAAGVRLPVDAAQRGGLATVTGAVEVRLIDLVNAYATLGRGGVRMNARLLLDDPQRPVRAIDAGVCAAIDDVLSSRARRPVGMTDLADDAVPWFMWKTGTSSGRRDAWAVGHNGRYAIGVWVGRFSGAGRYAYVGRDAAEPLLGRLFSMPAVRVLDPPHRDAPSIVVTRPLPAPPEVAAALRITEPHDGARFVAIGDAVTIRAAANRVDGVTWFRNGLALAPGDLDRMTLGVGRHELRCVDAAGRSDAVRIVVASGR